jgi:TRAP-type C4-dicarboxylate transport system substrate-binding protein
MLSLTQTGVADIAYVAPSFITDKLPLSDVAELPLGFSTSCEGTRAYYKLAADGIIADRELKPNRIRLLFTIVLPPYQVFLRGAGLNTIESVKGLKIQTSGKANELAVQALGAVPIQIATPDVCQALSRGTIDGMLFPYASIYPYDLQDLIRSASLGSNFGSFSVIYAIGERRWRGLPPEIQSALGAVGQEATSARLRDRAGDRDRRAGTTEGARCRGDRICGNREGAHRAGNVRHWKGLGDGARSARQARLAHPRRVREGALLMRRVLSLSRPPSLAPRSPS